MLHPPTLKGQNMNNNNDNSNSGMDMQLFPFFPAKEQIRSFKRNIPVSVYDFYIIDEIKEPDHYVELIHTLKSADPQDTVFLYLNTVGGNLYTTIQILAAMNSSHAKVITCLEGQVCSAGTFIFLKGDTKIVNPHSSFMVHSYSQSTSGKGNEIVEQINFMKKYFRSLAQDIYGTFLSDEELETVIKGHDIWLDTKQIVNRLEAHGHDYIYTGEDIEVKHSTEIEIDLDKTKPVPKSTKKKVSKKTATKKA